MTHGLFIAGTDTAVGKTTVGVGLARLAWRAGRRPVPYKPVETGCDPEPRDARRLWLAAGCPGTLAQVCPYPLALPAAPAAAASDAGIRLDVADLASRAEELAKGGEFLLVESAGGLLSPLSRTETAADLAQRLRLPVLLVARTALGTINHTALTLRELERRGLLVCALVLVRTTQALEPHERTNAELIEATSGVSLTGTLPYLAPHALSDPDQVAAALLQAIGAPAIAELIGDVREPRVDSSDK